MKIGLLTYHRNNNYGWNLQCYALMTILKSMNHDVVLIDKRRFEKQTLILSIKKICRNVLCFFHIRKKALSYEEQQYKTGIKILPFFEKHIHPKTRPIYSKKGYKSLPRFDALIVGSDQVWRSKLVYPIADYYFDFIKYSTKMISYAASFGVDYEEYTESEREQCGRLIKKFSAVSVRENTGVSLIKEKYKWECHPVVMPDPTLLLDREDYASIVQDYRNEIPADCLFCYILDMTTDKQLAVEKIASETSYPLHVISPYDKPDKVMDSVEEWLSSFMKAKFVFTDSFHGCVFSLIFRKPFIVYGNAARGLTRFTSLLNLFEQEKRLIVSSDDLRKINKKLYYTINNDKIECIQNDLKKRAMDFLDSSLSKGECR